MSKTKKKKSLIDIKWVVTIMIIAFLLSMLFSFVSNLVIPNVTIILSCLLVLFFILLGVLFDMIGVSSTTADPIVFLAMASRKIKSASLAIYLIQNSNKVSSICCDVVGDICGILSGSGGAAIAIILTTNFHMNAVFSSLLVTSLIAALTIGGKALGKGVAINKANIILEKFSKLLYPFMNKVLK